jgi:hypothetical protein
MGDNREQQGVNCWELPGLFTIHNTATAIYGPEFDHFPFYRQVASLQKAHLQANKQLHNPRAPFCTQQGSFGSTQFRRLLLLLLAHRA